MEVTLSHKSPAATMALTTVVRTGFMALRAYAISGRSLWIAVPVFVLAIVPAGMRAVNTAFAGAAHLLTPVQLTGRGL